MDPADSASDLLREIWRNRYSLWPAGVPDDPVDVIDLEKIANLRGYRGKQFRERPIAFWLAGDQYQELLWDLRERTGEFGH